MGNKKTFRRLRFTLVELIMAMAVFSIIAVIMMRFFSTSQQIYSNVSQRSSLYSDSRIALDMMNRELQQAMYSNGTNPAEGIYPFWFEKMRKGDNPSENSLTCPSTYYNLDFYSNQGDPANPLLPWQFELTQLNFISSTDMKPDSAESDVCEIRYTFVPVGMYLEPDTGMLKVTPTVTVNGVEADDEVAMTVIDDLRVDNNRPKVIREGWLVRCCTPDKYDDKVTVWPNGQPKYVTNPRWNFDVYPRITDSGATGDLCRVFKIWDSVTTAGDSLGTPPIPAPPTHPTPSIAYQKIIPYVYKLEFTCYSIMTLSGSISVIATPSAAVAGVGTRFQTEIKVGDRITVSGWTRTVTSIASNTALTVDSNFPVHAVEAAPILADPVRMSPLKIKSFTDTAGTWSSAPGLWKFGSPLLGTPFPDFVRIELSILPPNDWLAWKAAVQRGDYQTAQIIINKKLRTFSKTVYLENKN